MICVFGLGDDPRFLDDGFILLGDFDIGRIYQIVFALDTFGQTVDGVVVAKYPVGVAADDIFWPGHFVAVARDRGAHAFYEIAVALDDNTDSADAIAIPNDGDIVLHDGHTIGIQNGTWRESFHVQNNRVTADDFFCNNTAHTLF